MLDIQRMPTSFHIYQSNIQFDTQISQTNDAIAQGIASNIVVQENDRKASISDVHFISRIQATPIYFFLHSMIWAYLKNTQ